ncbi:MAG TPA: ABC transporter substrate-binding protein [Candidatus Binatus sp.]|nr:ABC transporter substrate-binding protein [Candidatus Binatus sp.]
MFAGHAAALTVEAPAGSGDAIASVKTIVDQSVAVFTQKDLPQDVRQQKLRAIAESHFDFAEMGRSACGYHWKTFTPEQKAEFVPLFTKFIEDVYLSQIESYSVEKINQQINSSKIAFTRQVSDSPDYAEVFSSVTLQDRPDPVSVNYEMSRQNGEWKIYDITIDAISVIANYRNQFNRVLNNDGYDKLIALMKQKIAGLQNVPQK